MAALTPAQEECNQILKKASSLNLSSHHPADTEDYRHDQDSDEPDEDARLLQNMIDNTMKMPVCGRRPCLPHRDFDKGRTTGVKGVIADARSYEEARRRESRKLAASQFRMSDRRASVSSFLKDEGEDSDIEDSSFVETWRQQRLLELQAIRNEVTYRRTSPSIRQYGNFEKVTPLGYLDAIEKVTPDTIVVVFVYDENCSVSDMAYDALVPIVSQNPTVRFVRIDFKDIEFDNAGVPAILAYKDQGNLFVNLTSLFEHIPGNHIDTCVMESMLKKFKIL